jgi:hypothetical protein
MQLHHPSPARTLSILSRRVIGETSPFSATLIAETWQRNPFVGNLRGNLTDFASNEVSRRRRRRRRSAQAVQALRLRAQSRSLRSCYRFR